MARKKAEESGTSAQVLEFLREAPDQTFSPKDIADALGLVSGRVSAALQYLSRSQKYPELVNEGRGVWAWNSEPPEEAPLPKSSGAGLIFEAVTIHQLGVVLKDQTGQLWLARPLRLEPVDDPAQLQATLAELESEMDDAARQIPSDEQISQLQAQRREAATAERPRRAKGLAKKAIG